MDSIDRTAAASSRGLWLLVALIALVAAGKVIQADTMDPDAFWHLRVADQLRHDGIGALVDSLSFGSEKTPWTPYSWLAELAMRAIWAAGGFTLAMLVTAACSAGIVVFTAMASSFPPPLAGGVRGRGSSNNEIASTLQPLTPPSPARGEGERNPLAVAVATAVAAFFTMPFISFRPVTFALLILAVVAWLLRRDIRRPSAWTWACVPLALLATNLHLYAVLIAAMAVLLVVGTWFDDRPQFRRRLILAIACSAAVCCTPMLRGAITTAINYNAIDPMVASNFITEMRPFYSGAIGKVSLALVIATLLLCLKNRSRLSMVDKLWLVLGVVALVRLGRFSPVYAILTTPTLTAMLPPMGSRVLSRRPVQIAMTLVLGFGMINVALALPGSQSFDHWLNRNNATYPTEAALYVDQHVPCRSAKIINEFNWGGYLEWRLGDRWQMLMDGRTQLFSPAFWKATHLGTPQTRVDFLRSIDADAAVLPVDGSCFKEPLTKLGWTVAHQDALAIVMVRNP